MKLTLPGNGAMDITYIPMKRSFVYLAAVIDWFTSRVLSWRLTITLEVNSCIEAVEEADARPAGWSAEIIGTDISTEILNPAK